MTEERKPGRYPLDAMGMSHTARLLTGNTTANSVVFSGEDLERAREQKRLRDRRVISRSDAFKANPPKE